MKIHPRLRFAFVLLVITLALLFAVGGLALTFVEC